MKPDPFEERLRAQPTKPIPPAWRQEVLGAARAGLRREQESAAVDRGGLRWLRDWLWPHPVAWAGLAACWVLVAGLHQAAAPSPLEIARTQESARMAAAYSALLQRPEAAAFSAESLSVDPIVPPRRRVPEQGRRETPLTSAFA